MPASITTRSPDREVGSSRCDEIHSPCADTGELQNRTLVYIHLVDTIIRLELVANNMGHPSVFTRGLRICKA